MQPRITGWVVARNLLATFALHFENELFFTLGTSTPIWVTGPRRRNTALLSFAALQLQEIHPRANLSIYSPRGLDFGLLTHEGPMAFFVGVADAAD